MTARASSVRPPPMLRPTRLPGWVRARDVVLTCAAWGLLLYLLRRPLWVGVQQLRHALGADVTPPQLELARVATALAPFATVAAALVAWLVVWALLRRKGITASSPVDALPAALADDEHGRWSGVDAAGIARLRAARIAAVDPAADGRVAAVRGD